MFAFIWIKKPSCCSNLIDLGDNTVDEDDENDFGGFMIMML